MDDYPFLLLLWCHQPQSDGVALRMLRHQARLSQRRYWKPGNCPLFASGRHFECAFSEADTSKIFISPLQYSTFRSVASYPRAPGLSCIGPAESGLYRWSQETYWTCPTCENPLTAWSGFPSAIRRPSACHEVRSFSVEASLWCIGYSTVHRPLRLLSRYCCLSIKYC